MEQEYIEINKQKIYFTIQRKKIKNINLRVNIDKKVYISVPFDMSIDTIKEFIAKKYKWINKQIEFYETFSAFLFGVFPFTKHTEKQMEAMKMANVRLNEPSIYDMVNRCLVKLIPEKE